MIAGDGHLAALEGMVVLVDGCRWIFANVGRGVLTIAVRERTHARRGKSGVNACTPVRKNGLKNTYLEALRAL